MIDQYVTIKLITGEELIAEVTEHDEHSITVMNPFVVATRVGESADGRMIEQQTASPYCSYAEDPSFTFDMKNVLFVKALKNKVISPYQEMVDKLNMKEMTADSLNQYLDALEALLDGDGGDIDSPYATEEDQHENSISYLEGNETLH
jgi:hypothetical protein